MGFLDVLGNIAKEVGNSVVEEAQKREAYYEQAYSRYSRLSEYELRIEYDRLKKSSGSTQSLMKIKALKAVCEERGLI